jgi:hypothetical protein
MTADAQELRERLADLEQEAEVLLGEIGRYRSHLRTARLRNEHHSVTIAESGTPLPPWWGPDYPGHEAFEDPVEKGRREALARQKEPMIRDESNRLVRPAGWDAGDDGNPYAPRNIEQRRREDEARLAEQREQQRKEEEQLNSPEYRGLAT